MTLTSLFRSTLLLLVTSSVLGDEVARKPLKPVLEVTKQFVSPPPFDKPLLHAPADAVPKNIILIIGDGMGQGALKLTSLYQHKAEGRLLMQQLPVTGFCTTRSASSDVTDSAAAATAMATGYKTANTFLGITPDKQQQLASFTEVAQRGGRAIGLITSDSITGATPASFYAHEASRGSYHGVAEHAAASGFDVLIGNNNGKAWFMPKAVSGQRTDARDVLSEMSASGYAVVTNLDSLAQAPHDKKILAFMDTKTVLGAEQILGQLTETALERLAKKDKGFFLMVECAITDAGGHSNNPDVTVLGTTQVDWALRSAVEFARTRGDTLVLVTADHETGGLTCNITNTPPGKLVINYSTSSHTSAPVRLFAYGPGSHLFKETIDNTDIAKNICRFWQLTLPAPIPFNSSETKITRYPDGRPSVAYRLEAKDHGVILKHGDGPGKCDMLGARDVWVYEDKGTYYMHYDGAGPKGWLCCLATSTNLVEWVKKGPVLDFGKTGEEDSASASYGVTYFDGTSWHMYYLGTPHVSPAPDLIPSFPYLTMKAKGASAAGPWTKQPEVVPFRIQPGTYYSATASPGHIIKQGDDYLMFFSASTHNPTLRTLSIARTRDLNGPWTVDVTPIVPLAEQIENSSLYFEPANQTWFLFTNHIGLEGGEYTDAVWVYWTKDLNRWNAADKAVVLDGRNCAWSRKCIGLPSVLKVGNRLAIIYDGPGGTSKSHMKRDVGLAWLELPLVPPASPVAPISLKCEQLMHPLGVDVTAPRLGWQIATGNRGWKQTAYQILVASSAERLAKDEGDLWDSGSVKSGDSQGIVYGGTTLKSRAHCFWKVKAWDGQGNATAWSQPAEWDMGIFSESEWKGQWIQSDLALFEYQKELKKIPDHNMEDEEIIRGTREKYIRKNSKEVVEAPAVWLRKVFATGERKVSRATLTISGLGLYEAYVNGRKINDHLLNVSPYDFGKSVPYLVHDVTAFIQKGTNGIGVILGNGYFNPVVPSLLREYAADFIDTPRLRCELALEYADGSTELVPSDLTWQFTTSGPIRFNSIRAGETYDARKELGDWSQGSYQAEAWLPARAANGPSGRLRNQALPPVRCIKEIPAVRVVPQKGGYRFDIGVECTGWARIKVRGKAGQKIIISYPGAGSHTLGRYQTCEYICKGEGEEVYEPRFAFNGYQFIDVQGLDYMPNPSDLVGCHVVSDLKSMGAFACSDERLNRLHAVNLRTLLNYYIQMPMDPVREKVCWTQDAQSNFENTAYNFDVEAIYAKWQEDFVDAILPNGYVPTVVPSCFDGPTINGPWWGGMIIYHPWQHYQFYGDKTILSKSYGAMKSQFAYLSSLTTNNVISWGLGDWMDVASEGKGRPKGTTVPFTSTCAYLMFADILQNTATLLGATDDAALYAKRAMEIRETINQKFYDPKTGTYDKGSQTSFILALKLNMMPQAERTKLVQKFAERIAQDKDHLSTGFVGTPFLLTFLNEEGLGDLAWKIATQDTYPSWFGMVFKNNLSVFRENWQGGLVQMPSLAGPIGAWFYRSLGGIRPGQPGFKEVIIEPYTKTLAWVNCSFQGPHGPIVVNWKKENNTFEMKLSIPANTTATVYLPATSLDSITEGGQTLDKAPGIALVRMEAERAVLRVASGQYTFGSRVTK